MSLQCREGNEGMLSVRDEIISFKCWQKINASSATPRDLFSWKKLMITSIYASIYYLLTMLFNVLVVSLLCWRLTLIRHVPNRLLAVLAHVSSISAWFQLLPSTPIRRARPCLSFPLPLPCPQLQTGSVESWIQATTRAAVGNTEEWRKHHAHLGHLPGNAERQLEILCEMPNNPGDLLDAFPDLSHCVFIHCDKMENLARKVVSPLAHCFLCQMSLPTTILTADQTSLFYYQQLYKSFY
jgi:hypothetical protein